MGKQETPYFRLMRMLIPLKIHKLQWAVVVLLFGLIACSPNKKTPEETWGYKPVYVKTAELKNVVAAPPSPMQYAGKIYRYGQLIFQIDEGRGIHVIDATLRNAPVKKAFIHVPGCSEISIRENKIYTNNFRDLVTIDMNSAPQYQVIHRIENIFPEVSQSLPPQAGAWFECPDPNQGTIIAWRAVTLQHPKCKRP